MEASAIFAAPVTIVSPPAPPGHFVEDDNDPIRDDPKVKGNDDWRMREFGRPASVVDEHTIIALVQHYYAAAASVEGARACSLIYSVLARTPTVAAVIPPDYLTKPPLPRVLRGEDCAHAAAAIFTKEHRLLVMKNATLQITDVRVKRNHAVAILGFRTTPQRWMPITREGNTWKIDSLLDHELP